MNITKYYSLYHFPFLTFSLSYFENRFKIKEYRFQSFSSLYCLIGSMYQEQVVALGSEMDGDSREHE